jgi:hypothetical protein
MDLVSLGEKSEKPIEGWVKLNTDGASLANLIVAVLLVEVAFYLVQ